MFLVLIPLYEFLFKYNRDDFIKDNYGTQRMFGSMGWAVTMFIMGIVLDYSTIFPSAK